MAETAASAVFAHLGSPRIMLAPMVDHSARAFRLLVRRLYAERADVTKLGPLLCYTPMFHARLFVQSAGYRAEHFPPADGLGEDKSLVVQLCANDPDFFCQAAKLVQDRCLAVDLNLGCPQDIARRGHYGSFLQDDWDLIASIVRKARAELTVPVLCKIRIHKDLQRTLDYAKMLEDAGCQALVVHGRVREQRGHNTGLADWEFIRAVKESLRIPVYANGNVLEAGDIDRCIEATGVQGVMTAEGALYNPAIFAGTHPRVTHTALQYLKIVRDEVPETPPGYLRGHLFKILRPALSLHTDIRAKLAEPKTTVHDYVRIVTELEEKLEQDVQAALASGAWPSDQPVPDESAPSGLRYPHWVCQPYVRPLPVSQENVIDAATKRDCSSQAALQEQPAKAPKLTCPQCDNGGSGRCPDRLCRTCCIKAGTSDSCPGHMPKAARGANKTKLTT